MKEVKCECGHVNPIGTVLCESCGKPLIESDSETKLVDMRYEGSARRSQTYNKTIIDKVWNFFSSVKVGVWLIVIAAIASALGTVFPQEMYIPANMPASEYYEEQYGWLGKAYYELGFHNLFSSWWYLLLIALIGVSLVICSLDRVVPLYRALKKQRVIRHENFLKRQRIFGATEVESFSAEELESLKEKLRSKKYDVREEKGNLLAEKGRFSRWGPYVNHCGLIIFLIGCMMRFIPGMYVDEVMWLREGERKAIPGTNGQYYLENRQFKLEVYDESDNEAYKDALERSGMVAKNYQSDVTLYKKADDTVIGEEGKLEKVKDFSIRVNQPLKFDHYALYQTTYKLDELSAMEFALENKKTKEQFGKIKVDLYNPESVYDLGNGYSVEIMTYFPDFEFDENGEPTTKSRIPNNPAFIFKIFSPEHKEGEISFVSVGQTIEPFADNEYQMAFTNLETKNVTGLTVRRDLTLWVIGIGGLIFMIGVVQGSYWNHRRIWIQRKGNEVWVAAHTNKNWYGLKRDISAVLEGTKIQEPLDQLKEE